MLAPLRPGHTLQLLEGSRALFPALIEAMDSANDEVLLETYIFDFSGSSAEIAYALERAARRGLVVRVLVDGLGTGQPPPGWLARFAEAGVQWVAFSPVRTLSLLWPGQWRRLHRKLCVVDRHVGFCGGINILDDFHDPNHGVLTAPRFDFSLRVLGPLVADMHAAVAREWLRARAMGNLRSAQLTGALVSWRAAGNAARVKADGPAAAAVAGRARASLVMRDNVRNRTSIEKSYLRAIGHAREDIIIANAYFVPGARLRRALAGAAQRGVRVHLLLQGRYEYFMQYHAARPVFGALLRAGVHIHEYAPSFLHAKVAVIDGHWATVGSSNLDPLSLLLAREANVTVDDRAFAQALRTRLLDAMRQEGRQLDASEYEGRPFGQRLRERLAQVVMRIALAVQGKKYR